jgi:hypothetical protein
VGNREEIEGHEMPHVVVDERPPRVRRRATPLRHQAGYGTLGDVQAEFREFAMDSWGAPEWVCGGHGSDEVLDLRADGRSACPPILQKGGSSSHGSGAAAT